LNHKIQALPLRDKIFTTMSNKSNAAWAFLAGAAVGATLGILYAPDKGKNTRDKLSFQLEKYRDKLKEYLDQLMNGKEVAFTPARSEGEKVVKDTRHQAETLLADVEQLMGQIKSRNNQ
jgi:gas vesicle protein